MSAYPLVDFLDMAVPLEMQRLADLDAETLCRIGRDAGQVIAEHGDLIQYRSPGTAAATAALLRGLAAAALVADGGVTFAGRHWCTNHARCEEVADAALPSIPEPRARTSVRPVTIMQLPA
jgi:hypothetical protein